jgi:hypothetical protein
MLTLDVSFWPISAGHEGQKTARNHKPGVADYKHLDHLKPVDGIWPPSTGEVDLSLLVISSDKDSNRMNSKLMPRFMPLMVVICSLFWLITSVQVLVENANTQYWREILGSLVAVAGLNGYLTAVIEDFERCLKAVTIRITPAGDVVCQPYLQGLWFKGASIDDESTRVRLARLVRDGRLELVRVDAQLWEARKEAFRAQGVNVDRGDAPGDQLLAKFRAGLTEFSARCNALMLPFVQNPADATTRRERLLKDGEIAEVCLGLARHVYQLQGADSWEADGYSCNPFSPWGIHASKEEHLQFRFYLSDVSVKEIAQRYEMEPDDLVWHRLDLYRYPESMIVRDFLPGLLCWSYLFKERIRSKGGILERIEDNYWPLIYWSIAIRAPFNADIAHHDPVAAQHLAEQIKKVRDNEESRREIMRAQPEPRV